MCVNATDPRIKSQQRLNVTVVIAPATMGMSTFYSQTSCKETKRVITMLIIQSDLLTLLIKDFLLAILKYQGTSQAQAKAKVLATTYI